MDILIVIIIIVILINVIMLNADFFFILLLFFRNILNLDVVPFTCVGPKCFFPSRQQGMCICRQDPKFK